MRIVDQFVNRHNTNFVAGRIIPPTAASIVQSTICYPSSERKVQYTQEQVMELAKCASDPMHFIENYVTVQHPIKGAVIFQPFDYFRVVACNRCNARFS